MSLKNKLKPVTAVALLQAAGAIYAVCYWQTTKTCANLNDWVNQTPNAVNPNCYDDWYATQAWSSPDAIPSAPGQDVYGSINFVWCQGYARRFDCNTGQWVPGSSFITSNYLWSWEADTSVPCQG